MPTVTVPCAASPWPVTVSAAPRSLPVRVVPAIGRAVFAAVFSASATAVGVTVTVTVAVAVPPVGSVTV